MVERATKSQKRLTKSKKWLGHCRSIKLWLINQKMADSQHRSMMKSENGRVTKIAWMTSQKMADEI
jgi:hypothetical protein